MGQSQNTLPDQTDIVVVGAGQAGLAVSRELSRRGLEHVVLERGRVGESWRSRWESFCLVTPNWTLHLPDQPYDGQDPDAFDPRDDIVGYMERYAAKFEVPVHEGVDARSLTQIDGGGFRLETSSGPLDARTVVLSTGAYQRPLQPPAGSAVPSDVLLLDVTGYTRPAALPDGPVLVVGSGQTGGQIAEELVDAGRDVYLSCGKAPWLPRRIGDHDLVWWLTESGYLEAPVGSLPDPRARFTANLLASGTRGGHDLHLRTLHDLGVVLLGRLSGIDGRHAHFERDLAKSLAWGDERYLQLLELFRTHASKVGIPEPEVLELSPLDHDPPETLDLEGFGAVVFTGGFRPDYESWVDVPGAFDELGFPVHAECASTVAPGLHFVGVHFLRKRKSALLAGVGEDAAIVAEGIAARGLP
jgi:putative flavoprotein involved in K+ transport